MNSPSAVETRKKTEVSFLVFSGPLPHGNMGIGSPLGAAAQHTGVRVTDDDLPSAIVDQVAINLNLVSAPCQRSGQVPRRPLLDADLHIPQPLPPRRVQRNLRVETNHDHLHMALGLHVTTHDAERPHRCVTFTDETGNDGVKGFFARCQALGGVGVGTEFLSAVLQGDAAVWQYTPEPKPW